MKIATWNILHGMAVPEGQIHNERLAARAALLNVDLLAIQEVDYFQERSHYADQASVIAESMGAPFISRAFAITGTPGEKWKKWEPASSPKSLHSSDITPSGAGNIANGKTPCYYGNGIISRIPIVEEFRLELGRSKVGAPLAIPETNPGKARPKIKVIYIHDEPRVAQAVHLANGVTVINTHLSFVPGMNVYQLRKIHQWAKTLPGEKILVGDLNLPGKIPEKIMQWQSAASELTYPSWGARVQFDHILIAPTQSMDWQKIDFPPTTQMVSDHLPLGIELDINTQLAR